MSKTTKLKPKKGWAVEIYGHDSRGNYDPELSCEAGILPVVHLSRSVAIDRRDKLTANGFKARVVRVLYAEPVKIS